jgi:murein DD-endopeptidase MepM/ murein hydrolase activator NlpD
MRIRSFSLLESVMIGLFCTFIILGTILVLNRKSVPALARSETVKTAPTVPEPARPSNAPVAARSSSNPTPMAWAAKENSASVTDTDVDSLKHKNLLIPVAGIRANQLHDNFGDQRSEGRQHQALDIPAASGTPVLATTAGTIIKLFHSDKGGVTLYESDPSGPYIYYYAHLSAYAPGITEGAHVNQGDTIAYVGDTGNAGPGNFHLHFAISKLGPGDRWSGGTPINPYPILSGK